MKNTYSLGVLLLFALFAMASLGPDASTNTTVAIKDCEEKPLVSVGVSLNIHVRWRGVGGENVRGAFGKILITHQKVTDNEECTYTVTQEVIEYTTDMQGRYVYATDVFNHDNSEDLFRVEVAGAGSAIDLYNPYKEVKVQKYNNGTFNFEFRVNHILD